MQKLLITLSFFTLSSYLLAQEVVNKFAWPEEYEPAQSKFYVSNEIEIQADEEKVWKILINALEWESWYEGAKNLSLLNHEAQALQANSILEWETMGLKFQSSIREFEPFQLLAWESKKKSIQGFHVWFLIPTETGCKVITSESQNGWLTFFEKVFQKNKLRKLHDIWLAELKRKAELVPSQNSTSISLL